MCIQCACLSPSVAYNVHTMCLLVTKVPLHCTCSGSVPQEHYQCPNALLKIGWSGYTTGWKYVVELGCKYIATLGCKIAHTAKKTRVVLINPVPIRKHASKMLFHTVCTRVALIEVMVLLQCACLLPSVAYNVPACHQV